MVSWDIIVALAMSTKKIGTWQFSKFDMVAEAYLNFDRATLVFLKIDM